MLAEILRQTGRFAIRNTPAILTGVGIASMVSSTVLAVRATPEVSRKLLELEEDVIELSTMDKIRLGWRDYTPSIVTGVFGIACLIGSHTVHLRRGAAIMTAYSVAEKTLDEYREKVIETLGSKKEGEIRDEIAKDRVEKSPRDNIIVTGLGDSLCYDTLTDRYFFSDIEKVRRAQNDINAQIINSGYSSQNDFYRLLNLASVVMGEELGWNTENLMDVRFSSHLTAEGRPCLSIEYVVKPVRSYYRIY